MSTTSSPGRAALLEEERSRAERKRRAVEARIVRRSRYVTAGGKLLWEELRRECRKRESYSGEFGWWASYERLAALTGNCTKTIRAQVRELVRVGLARVQDRFAGVDLEEAPPIELRSRRVTEIVIPLAPPRWLARRFQVTATPADYEAAIRLDRKVAAWVRALDQAEREDLGTLVKARTGWLERRRHTGTYKAADRERLLAFAWAIRLDDDWERLLRLAVEGEMVLIEDPEPLLWRSLEERHSVLSLAAAGVRVQLASESVLLRRGEMLVVDRGRVVSATAEVEIESAA